MSDRQPTARRVSPLRQADGRGLDPNVQAVIQQSARLVHGGQRRKVNVNLPADLEDAIKREAVTLTGHGRRGFSDLVAVLLRYGWDAYQRGELELEMQPTAVEMRIALKGA